MTTLAEHIIVAGAENRPPMLEKSMYDSWASCIRLFIKRKKHDDCDVHATNIILHGLPPDVYALVNHQEAAKGIWDRVKLLIKGTELSYQEHKCRLYNLFDKFAYVQGETLYEYYWRFSQLINDMHTIGMTMQQVQGNTKFLNALPLEWSKFVTDVKLAKSFYTTNYDQLYAYLSQHERHANEVRIVCERYLDPLSLVSNSQTLYNPSQSSQHSDRDDLSSAKAVLIENLSSCDSDVLSKVPYSNSYPNDMINQDLQEMPYSKQTHIDDFKDTQIYSDSNIISYFQYLQESQDAVIQDTNSYAPNDLLVLSLVEQMTDHATHLDQENQTNKMVNESLTVELERYKECIAIFVQRINVDSNNREKLIDSQMDNLIRKRNAKFAALQQEIDNLKKLFLIMEISGENLYAPTFNQLFEINELEAQLQENDTVIKELKDRIKSLIGKKCGKDLNAQLQEKVFAITAVKNELRKLKGKNIVDTMVSKPIAPGMFKINLEPLAPKIASNNDAPLKEYTITPVITPSPEHKVYCRKPKASRSVGISSKAKIVEYEPSNTKKPKQSWGSNVYDVSSYSLIEYMLYKLFYGLSKLKYQKDYLCSACALGKSKKYSHKPKAEDSIQKKLYLLCMDLYQPMRTQSINGRKYIRVIVDDYSRFTWVKFLRSKDEVQEFVIKFLKMIQVCLNVTIYNIRTNNGTEFVNRTLKAYYEKVRISHQTYVARTLQQNDVVEIQNHSLVEAA
uniref:Retrovirus-related Pol polyprotein from transposon TNT 1-94 n=1 Tax=Tanacetum cinerariifolium TaxID=118510 RepID=A0A6L2LTE0_TANCI|nr:retrovirus-related Pol polyprotein from transposon TNT 1-94 [Tanacetum cinerariifolium]